MMSPTIGKLAEALAKAQSEIKHAEKDKDNPFFKSSYADLASVWDACREPLTKNGLSVSQIYETNDQGRVTLLTLLLHTSGEYLSSHLPVSPVKNDPQGLASAMTYMKRAALSAIAGVAPAEKPLKDDVDDDDDDGEAASGRGKSDNDESSPKIITPLKGVVVIPPKSDSKPPMGPEMAQVINDILILKKQLKFSDDAFIRNLQAECQSDTLKGLNIEVLKNFKNYLSTIYSIGSPEVDPDWILEASGPL